jgi:hypothetical protein
MTSDEDWQVTRNPHSTPEMGTLTMNDKPGYEPTSEVYSHSVIRLESNDIAKSVNLHLNASPQPEPLHILSPRGFIVHVSKHERIWIHV